jgi:GLPGLI family protein
MKRNQINIFSKFLVFLLLLTQANQAQQMFISSGRLSFEKKTAQLSLFESIVDEGENIFIDELKKSHPKIVTDYYTLDFNAGGSLFKLEKEVPENKYMLMGTQPDPKNYVAQHFDDSSTIMRLGVFENNYLVKDSIQSYNWKMTGEVREIAGFMCRKAITKIGDSVVVVAFYTDEVLVRGGPFNFNGLPGMILGIAVPRLHMTIFATKLELANQLNSFNYPVENKPKFVTRKKVQSDIDKGVNDWGKFANLLRWNSIL